jgi:UDP-N-acetylmuramoyl-L-alanyl-D-glutamate--2,6-diaminopimelate ligase
MVYNSLAACAAMFIMGVPSQNLKEGLESIQNVPGRFELVDNGGRGFTLILDYAHTPDSLEQTLTTARGFAKGRLVTLFGCGGDRDRAKRPIMGAISGRLSDFTIITSDNPRTENPSSIIDMIVEGMKQTEGAYICIENRREAMRYALENAKPDDLIILAGKGHETYQEIHGVRYPFDEKEVVGELLKELS